MSNTCKWIFTAALLAFGLVPLSAQVVYVTARTPGLTTGPTLANTTTATGTAGTLPIYTETTTFSDGGGKSSLPTAGTTADAPTRPGCRFRSSVAAGMAFHVQPVLPVAGGTYNVEICIPNQNVNASADVLVTMTAASGCTIDTTTTTAFRQVGTSAVGNDTWRKVCTLTNDVGVNQPKLTFAYTSGTIAGSGRFYADTVRFTYLGPPVPDRTWDGGGTDDNWNTANNWVGDTVPATGEGVVFDGVTRLTPNMEEDYNVSKLNFNAGAGAFVIGATPGKTLTLGGDVLQNSPNLQTVNVPISLSSTRTINTAAGNLTIGGDISGAAGLTKSGANTLTLNGNNSQTGATTMSAGVLTVGAAGVLSGGAAPLTVAGGTLNLNNAAQSVGSLTGTGTGTVNLDASHTLTVNQTAAATFSGTVAGAGAFNKAGASTLTLTNFTATGVVGVNLGQMRVANPRTYDQNITVDAGGQFGLFNSTGLIVVNSLITGGGKVNRSIATGAAGNAVFNNPDSTVSSFDVRAGIAFFGANSTDIPVTKGPAGIGVITVGDDAGALGLGATNGTRTLGNDIVFEQTNANATNLNIRGVDSLHLAGAMTLNGLSVQRTKLIVENTTTPTFIDGAVGGGSSGLEKAGPGTLVLGNVNSYNGDTLISAGTLLATNMAGSGTSFGSVTVGANGTLAGSGTIAGPVIGSGKISPGASAGTLTLQTGLDLSSGGTNVWELASNSTTPGDFDQIAITGGTLVLGGSSQLALNFIGSATVPSPSNPFWQSAHTWTIITLSGGASNPGDSNFSAVQNGNFAAGNFTTSVESGTGNILLTFTPGAPVPAPQPLITSISGAGTTSVTVFWTNTVATTNYVLQYSTNLALPFWSNLAPVTAGGTTASKTDNPASGDAQRYYRVLVQ